MMGWKLVGVLAGDEFVSLVSHRREHAYSYFIGHTMSSPDAPIFFFADDVPAASLAAWRQNELSEFALLRVEAHEPVHPIEFCADEAEDIPAFWAAFFAGTPWPRDRSFRSPPHSRVAASITPRAVAWRGTWAGKNAADMEKLLAAGMDAVRGAPKLDKQIFFPVAGR